MLGTDVTAGLPPPPDPLQDERSKPVPPQINGVLVILHVLLGYARHLALTLEYRAAARGFSSLAQFYGTDQVAVIRARVCRALLRIQALQRVLLDRARRGRDLVILQPRQHGSRKPPSQPPAADPQAPQPPSENPPHPRTPRPRYAWDAPPDPASPPTLEQLEAEIRRRGVGRTLADIGRDLAISPSLSGTRFFNALLDALLWYRGDAVRYFRDLRRREVVFEPDMRSAPRPCMPERSLEGIRRMLGFTIGEHWPVTPSWVVVPRGECGAAAIRPP